jgi:mRNA interferase RelE/StbE
MRLASEWRRLADKSVSVQKVTLTHRNRCRFPENPRTLGAALKGFRFGDLWKYRVGDYRIIARIEDELLLILVVRIGDRKEVYR